jgi:spore coat polysaccharide biosynthesis protein SpsF
MVNLRRKVLEKMKYNTEQEGFWQGVFGDEYLERNKGLNLIASNIAFFSKIFNCSKGIQTVLELGSNIGLNLIAIKQLLPQALLSAVEINEKASIELKKQIDQIDLHLTSILKFVPMKKWDFVFTKGVLIHINPNMLQDVYKLMYDCSSRYILVSEYYSPKPVEVVYRGHSGKLFKRDFAGEILDLFPDLSLIEYGFVYHRDPIFPQDDMTWFLLEKN